MFDIETYIAQLTRCSGPSWGTGFCMWACSSFFREYAPQKCLTFGVHIISSWLFAICAVWIFG